MAKKGQKREMTEKQKRFADEYLISLNATQAAIKAGYGGKFVGQNADKLLKNTKVSEYISARMAEKEARLIANQDEILKYLTSVMRGESVSEVVVVEGGGNGFSEARRIEKSPDEKERLKAAELLGKRYGLYTEKMEVDADVSPIVIRDDVHA